MKLLLAHKFFHLTGGADVFFIETGRIFESRGNDVAYFSTHSPDNLASPFSKYFCNPPNYLNGNLISRVMQIGKMIYAKEAQKKFAKLIDDFKPDIIHVFAIHIQLTPSILVAAHEAKVPVVMSCNDYKHICPNYKLYHHNHICSDCLGSRFYKAVTNRCCKNSLMFSVASCLEAYVHSALEIYRKYIHTYLFSSEFMVHETEKFWGKGSFRWRLFRNPFDSRKFPLVEEYGDYCLFIGRFVEEKGVEVLLRAARHVPDVKIKIVGNGPQGLELRHLANQLSVNNIEFVGPVWGDDLNNILSRSRFLIVPSVWHENFPYVINQAFAFGKPVIGTDRGGIPELVSHGERGIVYPAEDDQRLAEAMQELWSNPDRALQMGQAAKAYSDDEFNDDRQYDRQISIYKGVLNENIDSRR